MTITCFLTQNMKPTILLQLIPCLRVANTHVIMHNIDHMVYLHLLVIFNPKCKAINISETKSVAHTSFFIENMKRNV